MTAAFVFRFAEDSSAGVKSDAVSLMDNNRQAWDYVTMAEDR